MSRITRVVIARFPEHELAIERLARRSESFHAMCEDYAAGVEALQRWLASTSHETEIAELRASLAELEEEIVEELLGENTAGRRVSRR